MNNHSSILKILKVFLYLNVYPLIQFIRQLTTKTFCFNCLMTIQESTLFSKIKVNYKLNDIFFPVLVDCSELLVIIDHGFILKSLFLLSLTIDSKCASSEGLAQSSADQFSSLDFSLLKSCLLLHASHYTKHNLVRNEMIIFFNPQ